MELIKKSVDSVIEKDRIGSPVFLRCVLHIVNETMNLLHPAAEIVSLSNGWIPSKPQCVYAQGDADATQITVMVQYDGGQMAVLSVNRVDSETAIDLMLVGNKGVIYYETPIGRHYMGGTPPEFTSSGELSDVLAEALSTGQPISVEG